MTDLDTESLGLLEDTLRKTMLSASGAKLDTALARSSGSIRPRLADWRAFSTASTHSGPVGVVA